jgi:O-antigen ligase
MKKFPALHTISFILKIFAWIAGIATVILSGTIIAGKYNFFSLNMGNNIVSGIVILLIGFFYVLMLYAAAEAILVILAIEENTRKTTKES